MIFYDTIEEARNAEVYTHIFTTPEDWKAKTTKGKFIACVITDAGFLCSSLAGTDEEDRRLKSSNLTKWVMVEEKKEVRPLKTKEPSGFGGGVKSPYVPLLVERLDIGESTAWLWLKKSGEVIAKSHWKHAHRNRRVNLRNTTLARMKRDNKSIMKLIDPLCKYVESRSLSVKNRKSTVVESDIIACAKVLSTLIDHTVEDAGSIYDRVFQVITQAQRVILSNQDEITNLCDVVKKANKRAERDVPLYLYRRVQAAITSERTDWTPITDVAGHLESQFGVTVKQVAEWYGYNPHSIYGIIGNGRFVEKRPKRALTLVDYYLKENELC